MIGRTFFEACLRHIAASQQSLTTGRKLNVMRHVQIFQRLLHHSLKDWSRDLPALVQPNRGIENHYYRQLRIINRSESRERRNILCL